LMRRTPALIPIGDPAAAWPGRWQKGPVSAALAAALAACAAMLSHCFDGQNLRVRVRSHYGKAVWVQTRIAAYRRFPPTWSASGGYKLAETGTARRVSAGARSGDYLALIRRALAPQREAARLARLAQRRLMRLLPQQLLGRITMPLGSGRPCGPSLPRGRQHVPLLWRICA
jgi:hypothetical protein